MISSGDRRGGWAKAAGALPGRARRSFAFFFFHRCRSGGCRGRRSSPLPGPVRLRSVRAAARPRSVRRPGLAGPGSRLCPAVRGRGGAWGCRKGGRGRRELEPKACPVAGGVGGGAPPTEPLRLFLFLEVFIRAPFLTWRRAAILLLPPAQGGR